MLRGAWLLAAKDLRLMAGRGGDLVQAGLLGVLLVALFGMALPETGPASAAAIFWLASAFCLTIIFSALYAQDETNLTRLGLALAPMPVQGVWLGKAAAGLVLLLAVQAALLAASAVFLDQAWRVGLGLPALGILTADLGLVALAALLTSLVRGRSARESLCSLVMFPLMLPQLLAGIRLLQPLYDPLTMPQVWQWAGIALAFDGVFVGLALVLFPFMYGGE